MKRLRILSLFVVIAVICLLGAQVVCAAAPDEEITPISDVAPAEKVNVLPNPGNDVNSVDSYYLVSQSISIDPYRTNYARVKVETKTFQDVYHLYHDITIYKNWVWQLSDRYQAYNTNDLVTYINVPAVEGDYIDVYVDSYAENDGYTESASNSYSRYL